MNPTLSETPLATAAAAKIKTSRRRAERRVAHRVPCRVRASEAIPGKGVSAVGQTVNLSANGLAVQLARPMDQGTAVEVLLPPLDGEPTRVLGTVAHSRRVLSGTFEIGILISDAGVDS
jgi:hypothetical protein